MVLAAALAGCATDKGDDVGPGGGGTGGDPTPPPPPPEPLDGTGTYRIHSTFDIAENMPGAVGSAVNGLIDATDDPDDPMKWVLDQAIASMSPGTLKDLLVAAEPVLAPTLNDQLTSLAPGFVDTLDTVGQDLADIAKHFGLSEKLVVVQNDQTYQGTMTADGVELQVAGQPYNLKFADHQMDDIVADGLAVSVDATNTFTIGRHTLPISYGKVLVLALDAAVIPAIDSNASNLGELLNDMVDCQAVGQQMADAIGIGGQALWAGACISGLDLAADQMYAQLEGIDSSALEFVLDGKATAVDTNADRKVDRLDNGTWLGTLGYGGTDAPLGPATFVGARGE